MEPDFDQTNWVYDSDALKKFNKEGECVCGKDLSDKDPIAVRWGETSAVQDVHCERCDNRYFIEDSSSRAEAPTWAVLTEAEPGFHKVEWEGEDQAWDLHYATLAAIGLISRLNYYPEKFPFNYGEVWAYVDEHQRVLSVLVQHKKGINLLGTVPGYQRNGLATKLVLHWTEQKGYDTIRVHGWFDETEEFYEKLPMPVKDLSDSED